MPRLFGPVNCFGESTFSCDQVSFQGWCVVSRLVRRLENFKINFRCSEVRLVLPSLLFRALLFSIVVMSVRGRGGVRGRLWCFTIFPNVPMTRFVFPVLDTWAGVLAIAYQQEVCPDSGRLHLQGVVRFDRPMTLAAVKDCDSTAHWEPCRSLRASLEYCSKEETRALRTEPVNLGDWGHQGRRSEGNSYSQLHERLTSDATFNDTNLAMDAELFSLFVKHPSICSRYRSAVTEGRDRDVPHTCVVVYGKSGLGKSYWADSTYPDAYRKPPGQWWPEYSGQKVVLFEDFLGKHLPFSEFLLAVDSYNYRVQFKGGFFALSNHTTVITTNIPPLEWWSGEVLKNDRDTALTRRLTRIIYFTGLGVFQEYASYAEFAFACGLPLSYVAPPPAIVRGDSDTEIYNSPRRQRPPRYDY